ncbi:hypothetical protein L902_21580 [Agrobacterium radiobacter DSM 30147]|nr:hypothetical protein L902_21580 [Agrobacterium radiobacter DSM 30147]
MMTTSPPGAGSRAFWTAGLSVWIIWTAVLSGWIKSMDAIWAKGTCMIIGKIG